MQPTISPLSAAKCPSGTLSQRLVSRMLRLIAEDSIDPLHHLICQ